MNALYSDEPLIPVDYDSTIAEYQASRARYIRTVTSDAEKRLMETVGKRREPLREEINNLTDLAFHRHATYVEAVKAYQAKAPGRVTKNGIQPPLPTDRTVPGIMKVYKAAVQTAEEFRDVEAIIKKRKDKLAELDWKLREQVEQYGRSLIAQLETERGLQGAFMRDPLLSQAYARMQAAEARRASVREQHAI